MGLLAAELLLYRSAVTRRTAVAAASWRETDPCRGRFMNDTHRIDEHGWWSMLLAPMTAANDRRGRNRQAIEVFSALAPIMQPLAMEMEQCWRELDTGLVAPDPPSDAIHLLTRAVLPNGVVTRSSYMGPPVVETVPRLD